MRILLTHERFLPEFGGGGEEIVYETAKGLAERNVEVSVLTTGDPAVAEYRGIPTERLPRSRYRLNTAVGPIAERAKRADLIHTFNYHACLPSLYAGRRTAKPVVCTILGLFGDAWLDMKGPVVGRAFRAWERLLLRRPFHRTLYLSDFSRSEGIALGAREEQSHVIPPGVDSERFRRDGPKESYVVYVGKLERRKGIGDFIETARALPDIPFRMVGWGPDAATLQASKPSNVELAGFLEGDALADALARARLFLFPSKAETFGLVIAQAMAAGCPVVSTIPLEYEGARVEPGDVDAMAASIRALWDDPARAKAAGEANRARAAKLTWSRYTGELVEVYETLLREPGGNH